MVSKVEGFENDIVIMISLSCRRIVVTEKANFLKSMQQQPQVIQIILTRKQ